ncbi:UDP-N-acetylmuramoyl-L-alanine--D-glutamate ligase [Caldinitratiruptor microaerophilus]|uniref:UDP-N-acetylmuramoylalanine--D-glutamate ligase n=1 Tax=Caldinitratiruptor microaerophilus TaxID=671077 RepID=A0AA35CKN8_9FIRM|nr:UDP-N-acetylmuramoyl-L-alanine--D-glutamate ligase [Caldinitratiruptor microaerophilus]BDG59080.1 UDP-N-acetylmuramoylalanine--D-glutamate ligase [Caldinitratiruptor microaerophilus]
MNFAGQKVAVVGLGRSNLALIRWLRERGARVTALDRARPEELGDRYRELLALGVEDLVLGPSYLDRLAEFPVVFLTPGMPKHLPPIAAARAAGAWVTGEIPLVLRLARAPVVGITGSAGKTTTTTLVGEILKASGREVYVGGNIGRPLIEVVETIPPTAVIVLELSSFQLELADRSPPVAVITNVTPNHLDVHPSMEAYVDAKRNIYRFQGPEGRVVLSADNPVTAALAAEVGERAILFSRRGDPGGRAAAYVDGDQVLWRLGGDRIGVVRLDELRIPGAHNVENVLAAVAAAFLAGGTWHGMRQVLPHFAGVEHRLEPVREVDGVRYVNDSKATAPAETMAALAALPGPIVLIAGGYDKRIAFDDLARAIVEGPVHTLVLMGATAGAIEAAVEAERGGRATPRVLRAKDMEEAVRLARQAARPGDTVLLSPACASYDLYANFEERGRHFKALVHQLA